MRFIGDIHCKLYRYMPTALDSEESVQVGDFGMGFRDDGGREFDEAARQFFLDNPTHKFIRGNHDNPVQCRMTPGWIPDGTYDERGIMYAGGAWSIDEHDRVEGVSWWRDEQLSIREFMLLMDLYTDRKPKIMVTHDAPESVAREFFFGAGYQAKTQNSTVTGQALDAMLEVHQPDLWIFGHWHTRTVQKVSRYHTQFICLGELEYIDIDI